MKKIMALILVVAMLMAIVPATLAVTEDKYEKTANNSVLTSPFAQNAVDVNGNIVVTSDMRTEKTIGTENVSKKYHTLKADDFNTKDWMADTPRVGLEMQPQDESFLEGYWITKDNFALIDDWYNDGTEVLAQIMHPTLDGEYYQYMEGESVWFNYDLQKSWDAGSQQLIALDKEVAINCYLFGGTAEDFMGEGEGIVMVNAWMSGQSGISCKVTAPVDNYVFMFVFIIADTTLTEFGAWTSISSAEAENEFKNIVEGPAMTVGQAVTTNVKGADSSLVLMPDGADYKLAYGAKHKIELEGGKNYVAMIDSADSIGAQVYFCDENMDVINYTFVGSGAIANGAQYKDSAMIVMPPVSGTYYIVTCGFYMGDEGELEATVYNWEEVASPLVTSSTIIDLDALGTETYVEEVAGVQLWGYYWYSDYSLGELIIAYPGNYTVKGSNANVFCDIYDGVNLTLDNATIGSVWKGGLGYAPSTITAKGDATIENTSLQFSVYNYEGINSGLYITGDRLTVISGGESMGAIITDETPVHILTKTLEVYSTPVDGAYPVSIWTTGKNHPELTIAAGAEFDGDNKLAKMYYDGDGYFFFGYTVSVHEELYRLHNEPGLEEASLEFVLSTEGFTPGPGTMLGDANVDGLLNTGDATTILKYAAQMIELEGQGLKNADINEDNSVNTGDAAMVLRVAAGIIPDPNL
ncbi:MAG: dockerin type I repeat-containing protein [Clostridia bacterium]|nr:dockerin type I repeat-containing protein [Clostridia bacterium]